MTATATDIRKLFAAAAIAAFVLLAAAPVAQAGKIVDRIVAGTEAPGTAAGLFDDPRSIAFNDPGAADGSTDPLGASTDGYLYLVDEGNHRVQVFDAAGNFKFMFGKEVNSGSGDPDVCTNAGSPTDVCGAGSAGGAAGQLNNPNSVAINQANGDVYVYGGGDSAGANNLRVQHYEADGTFVRAWGWGVATGASAFETCTASCQAGLSGDNGGQFARKVGSGGSGIAVDPQPPHHVFVGDTDNERVQEFAPDGTFVRLFGWGVVDEGQPGDLGLSAFEICSSTASGVCRAAPDGGELEEAGINPFTKDNGKFDFGPTALAIDPAGTLYGSGRFNEIQRFDTDAATPEGLARARLSGTAGAGERALAIDPVSGNLLASDSISGGAGASGTVFVSEFDISLEPPEEVEIHLEDFGGGNGLAVDPVSGDFYLTTGHRLFAADDDGAPPAAMSIDPPLVEGRVASFSGTVTPGGPEHFDTSYRFEYGKDGSGEWSRLPLVDVNIGDGSEAVPVSQTLDEQQRVEIRGGNLVTGGTFTLAVGSAQTGPLAHDASAAAVQGALEGLATVGAGNVSVSGPEGGPWHVTFGGALANTDVAEILGDGSNLTPSKPIVEQTLFDGTLLEPNAIYGARLVSSKAFGNPEVFSASQPLFETAAIPPEAQTLAPAARGATSARLAARINPNNSPTGYWFEWGADTSYGNRVPVPDGFAGEDLGHRVVVAEVDGLQPNTTYHYRVVADNGVEASPGVTEVSGGDVAFTTRAQIAAPGGRAYEMVTPPFKTTRATGLPQGLPGENPNPTIASLDGDSVAWNVSILPLSDDAAAPLTGDKQLIRRTAGGWVNQTRNTLGLLGDEAEEGGLIPPSFFTKTDINASSGDFESTTWKVGDNHEWQAGLLPTEGKYANRLYTRRDGTGTEGFTPWLTNPEQQIADQGFYVGEGADHVDASNDQTIFDDEGSAMARWGNYRGLGEDPSQPGDEDPSDDQQLPGQRGGSSAYLQRTSDPAQLPGAGKELASECTGTPAVGDATQIPARLGSGEAGDTIGTQTCEEGNVVNRRGATVGGRGTFATAAAAGPAATALADDGNRVYFQAPDHVATTEPTGGGIHPSISACASGTGIFTACPPQLFVRQYDAEGDPMVRWVSRSRSEALGENRYGGAMIAGQRIAEIGRGTAFQGASRDGRVVYFKTNAPLTPDDPNGGVSITAGSAQETSWDLYRYELPASLDADPEDGALQRISGGPTGEADPAVVPASSVGESLGDASLRFHSDDGSKAYFLTTSPIAGADETPPAGGATAPGGSPGNIDIRNLYLFDAEEDGAARWRFIARLPYSRSSWAGDAGSLNSCASSGIDVNEVLEAEITIDILRSNCFRGTAGGEAIAFMTAGRLTGDDGDAAADVYLYDAATDELVRITAPPVGEQPYPCHTEGLLGEQITVGRCNGELGRNQGIGFFSKPIGPWDLSRGWGGMRYYNLAVDEQGVVSAYFASQVSFVPEDSNEAMDVYEWRNGELSLISPGNQAEHAWFSGNSVDGRDVFFVTGARLDPRELDDADQDIYDARIGGGFPYVPPPVPCDVLAFACEGDAIAPPALSAPATLAIGPSGNVAPRKARRACAKRARGARRAVKRAKALRRKAAKARRGARKSKGRRAARRAKQAARLNRRARGAAKRARRAAKGAKRCRARSRGANRKGRASR